MRVSIEAKDQPGEVLVNQPGEKLHRREVAAGTSYEFECVTGTVIGLNTLGSANVHPDSLNQRPSPNSKAHPGQTSITSSLQPEDPSVTAQREQGTLPHDVDLNNPFSTERGRTGPVAERLQDQANLAQAEQDGALNEKERKGLEEKQAAEQAQKASQEADKAIQEGEQGEGDDGDQRKGKRGSRGA